MLIRGRDRGHRGNQLRWHLDIELWLSTALVFEFYTYLPQLVVSGYEVLSNQYTTFNTSKIFGFIENVHFCTLEDFVFCVKLGKNYSVSDKEFGKDYRIYWKTIDQDHKNQIFL